MSHPLVIVENAVRYFMSQWLNGQQPYLNIKTHINGEIYVRSEVRCAGAKAHSQASLSQRKSGHYSRQRRRSRRSKKADHSVVPPACRDLAENPSTIQETVQDETLHNVGQITLHEDTNHLSKLSLKPVTSNLVKPNLTVCVQDPSSFTPEKPKLSSIRLDPISIPPSKSRLSNLSIQSVQNTSIPPKAVFHPAIIRASLSMFKKKPDSLTLEEVDKFNMFIKWKLQNGEPIEVDILYNPAGGNQNCLHCDRPT